MFAAQAGDVVSNTADLNQKLFGFYCHAGVSNFPHDIYNTGGVQYVKGRNEEYYYV